MNSLNPIPAFRWQAYGFIPLLILASDVANDIRKNGSQENADPVAIVTPLSKKFVHHHSGQHIFRRSGFEVTFPKYYSIDRLKLIVWGGTGQILMY